MNRFPKGSNEGQAAGGPAAPGSRRRVALLVVLGLIIAAVAGFLVLDRVRDDGDPSGSAGSSTTVGPQTTIIGSTAPVDSTTAGPLSTPTSATEPATTPSVAGRPRGGRLVLGGDDLGVTRVGAPSREAVAAVTGVLGRPLGDPAKDSACIGAVEEATWEGFRLGISGGMVSGWLSTSRSLATPKGTTVGTNVAALRQAYGATVSIAEPAEPGEDASFSISGTRLSGSLSGSSPTDAVTAIFTGTCAS